MQGHNRETEEGDKKRGARERETTAFCWEVEQAQSAQSAARSVQAASDMGLCVCVLLEGGEGWFPLCQPVSVPLHKPQWTDKMNYEPDVLVTTAALK